MSSIRFVSLAGLALIALSSVACAARPYEGNQGEGGSSSALGGEPSLAQGTSSGQATNGQPGTCAAACDHYLGCRNAKTSANQTQCVTNCSSLGLSSADLASFVQTDCPTAIATVEGSSGGTTSGGTTGGTTSGSAPTNECTGCVSDGSSCIWASQSNWGQGPYSGAVMECASHCCP